MKSGKGVTYEGTVGKELGMALGGLGTGTLEIGRDGSFQNVRVQNDWAGSLKPEPRGRFFSLHVRTGKGKCAGRLLQLQPSDAGAARDKGHHDVPVAEMEKTAHCLPCVEKLTYTGRFPFVAIDYEDPDVPCEVSLEAFSPFVPQDAESSSVPVVFFTFRVRNRTREPLRVSVATSWVNDIAGETYKNGWPSEGNRNTLISAGGLPAVLMDARADGLEGSEYLLACLPSDGVRYSAVSDWRKGPAGRWKGPNFRAEDPQTVREWETFLRTGRLPEESRYDDGLGKHSWHLPVAAVAGEVDLKPGEAKEIRFALVWFFPHHMDRQTAKWKIFLGHQYAVRFPGGTRDVAAWVFPRRENLREQGLSWRKLIEESSLPPNLRDLVAETLYLLPRISWWMADGRFCFYESADCPRMHPTILDRYMAPVMAALFPELHANSIRLISSFQTESGEIPSTLGVVSVHHPEYRVFNPGDAGTFPVTATWEMLWGGDRQFVVDMYPVIRKVLQWGKEVLDEDGDGVPDCHGIDQGWDTFPMHGAAAYMADQWMTALLAGEYLARYVGDKPFAEWCARVRKEASETAEKFLWNGNYYSLAGHRKTGEKSDICFIDQFTYGTLAAEILELGAVHPRDRVRKALQSIWRLNVRPCNFVARAGSNPDGSPADCTIHKREDGASQSNSFSPVTSAPLAAAAIRFGMVKEGLELAEEMADVVIRKIREPWSGKLIFNSTNGEWFYGMHYSDCLILWDLLHVLIGLHVNMLEERMTLEPPAIPVRIPVFTRYFMGQVDFSVRKEAVLLTLRNASEKPAFIPNLLVALPGRKERRSCTVESGKVQGREETSGGLLLKDVRIAPGGTLTVRWK